MTGGALGWKIMVVELVAGCPAVCLAPERRRGWYPGESSVQPLPCFASLAAKLSHVGANVDGLACCLH
jgi:hypothetical protein